MMFYCDGEGRSEVWWRHLRNNLRKWKKTTLSRSLCSSLSSLLQEEEALFNIEENCRENSALDIKLMSHDFFNPGAFCLVYSCPDNIASHEKQEQRDSQIQPSRNYESIATSLVYSEQLPHPGRSAHSMAPGHYPYQNPYYRSIFAPPCDTQVYPPRPYTGVMGIQQQGVVPLPSDAVEEPVFVNAKQYHGIIRRRQSRAKLESQNKVIKSRKPYLHESRHLHAIRRPRGCGGRFLNAKKEDEHREDSSEENSKRGSDKSAMAASNGTS